MNSFSFIQASLPTELVNAFLAMALAAILGVAGVFAHLNYYTRRTYFTAWTGAWLALGLWMALSLVGVSPEFESWMGVARQLSLALAAGLHLMGAALFQGMRIRKTPVAAIACVVVGLSCVSQFLPQSGFPGGQVLNGWIGVAYAISALSFVRARLDRGYVGAGLVALGFSVMAAVFVVSAFASHLVEMLGSAGVVIVGGLQWLIAIAMVVLLMEEMRRTHLVEQAEAVENAAGKPEASDFPLTSILDKSVKGMSRELNEPLAITTGYLDLVLRDKALSVETREALEKVAQENHRMGRMLQHFLAAVRPGMSRREEINLNKLIEEIADARRSELRLGGIDLEVQLDPYLPSVAVFTERMENAIHALFSQALEAALHAPGPHRVRICTERADRAVRVSVEHNGAPMPETPTQGDEDATQKSSRVRAMSALEVARTAAAEHNGTCVSEPSNLGGGRICIEFPITHSQPTLVQSEMNTQVLRKPASESTPKAPTVLVVDDEPMITELLKEMIEALGYEAVACNQGQDALDALGKWHFDAVMSDFRMPGMDGKRFYKEVTQRKPEMSGRFIFLTGDTCNSDTLDFVESVGARCVGKPFHLDAMDKTLSEVLQQPLSKAA